MRKSERIRETKEPVETVFLRVPRSVSREFRRQAKEAKRKLGGHFEALVEKGKAA